MSDRLSAAIDELEEHLARQLAEAADTKKTINSLRKAMGLEPKYTDTTVEASGSIRPDQYYGKALATAAADYLERRKQAASAEEIMRGLEQGGFDFESTSWKEKDRLRLLAVSLAKNTVKFHKLPNGTFGLVDWYDQAFLERRKQERKQNASAEEAEAEVTAEESEKASA